MAGIIQIKDTGFLDAVSQQTSTTALVNSGNWFSLPSSRLNFEFTTRTTNNQASETVDGFLQYNPNDVTSTLPPRLNINMFLKSNQTTILRDLIKLQKSTNVKLLKGGIMTIDSLDNAVDDNGEKAIYVIVKNLTISEVVKQDIEGVAITLQLEQV